MGRRPIDSQKRRIKMLRSARDGRAEIAVASRYADWAEVRGRGSVCIATSKVCTFAARLLFPRRMRDVTDRLGEFFIVRREAIDPDHSQFPHLKHHRDSLFVPVPYGAQPHSLGRDRWALTAERGLQQ